MDCLKWLQGQQEAGLLRQLRPLQRQAASGAVRLADSGQAIIDFSSNDYLGLSCHPQVITAGQQALAQQGCGAGAARLMSGDFVVHHELEQALATYKEQEAALLFGSGYQCNSTVIPALMGRHDVIFADRLSHASIVDGCRVAGCAVHRFRHNDLGHLAQLLQQHRGPGAALIVVESLYSMDGDFAPLAELVALKEQYDCLLMVDEAHATGLFGPQGSGLVAAARCSGQVDIVMGTLGKALGGFGAFIAAEQVVIDYLINRARGFIYSTALPPALMAASLAAIKVCQEDEDLRRQLWDKVAFFIRELARYQVKVSSASQIIPLFIGASDVAVALADSLRKQGVLVTAVRPPTVPQGSARLRLSVTCQQGYEDLGRAAELIAQGLERFGR